MSLYYYDSYSLSSPPLSGVNYSVTRITNLSSKDEPLICPIDAHIERFTEYINQNYEIVHLDVEPQWSYRVDFSPPYRNWENSPFPDEGIVTFYLSDNYVKRGETLYYYGKNCVAELEYTIRSILHDRES